MFRVRILKSGRGWSKGSSLQKGDLKYVILDLMKDKPRYGYEIIQEIEERSHGLYKPSPGVIYPTLQMLEEMGYASATEQDGKKVYSMTEQGHRFLEERKGVTDEVKNQMKFLWSFKNSDMLEIVLEELYTLESLLLDRKLRNMDVDKMERIRAVISQAGQAINNILREEVEIEE